MTGVGITTHSCNRQYREEDWIDWLLGNKPQPEYAAMKAHLRFCRQCGYTVAEWGPLLLAREEAAGTDAEAALPSPALHRRLRSEVKARSLWIRVRRQGRARWLAAAAAGLVLLLCIQGLYRTMNAPLEQRDDYVALHEPGAIPFLHDPQTASFKVFPYNDGLGNGYVWFNDSSREIFVLLEGLLPSDGHVIQAWAVDGSGYKNLGLLHQHEASRAHLYVKGPVVTKANNIVLTVEPNGGSRNPTPPDVFVFRLQH